MSADFWVPGPGTDTDAIHDNVAGEINALTGVTPVSGDWVLIEDASDSNNKKKVNASNFLSGIGAVPQWVEYLAERQGGETSHADDDFFDDATAGGTAVTVSGTATWAEAYDRLGVLASGQTASDAVCRLFALTPTTTPVTIETAMTGAAIHQDLWMAGILLTDGTAASSNCVMSSIMTQTADTFVHMRQAAGTLTSIFTDINADPVVGFRGVFSPIFLRLVWSAANTFEWAYASHPGGPWHDYGTTSRSKTMTPTHFGVFATTHGGSEDVLAYWDYLRVNESDLSA